MHRKRPLPGGRRTVGLHCIDRPHPDALPKLVPLLHAFADELGEGMSGKRKDTPQAAVPRRAAPYNKEDLV